MTSAAEPLHRNPVSPENLLNPLPFYADLRENDPVHWSDVIQAWIITRHEDVTNYFRDSRLSADRTHAFERQFQGRTDVIQDFLRAARMQMMNKDGAEHLRLRRLANPGFSPQSLDAWRPAIRRTAEHLLEQVQAQGRMDLAKEFSYQFPVRVIAELMAVPTEDRRRFQQWAEPVADFVSPSPGADIMEVARRANDAMRDICNYLAEVVEQRRHTPGNDILSQMIHAQEGGRMSVDELVSNAMLVLSAGHLTTTDQLSNGVHELLSHPEQLRMLRESPELMKSAVEEMLRFCPPLLFTQRVVAETFVLHGRTLRKGDMVFLGLASANRDPRAFPDPDRFDITRDNTRQKHMTFAFGPHHCLGAGLARRELEVAFEVLLERLPGLRLDEAQPPRPKCDSLLFRGFNSLPVKW